MNGIRLVVGLDHTVARLRWGYPVKDSVPRLALRWAGIRYKIHELAYLASAHKTATK